MKTFTADGRGDSMSTSYKRVFEVSMPGERSLVYTTFCRRKSRALALAVGKYVRVRNITHRKNFLLTVNLKHSAKRLDV